MCFFRAEFPHETSLKPFPFKAAHSVDNAFGNFAQKRPLHCRPISIVSTCKLSGHAHRATLARSIGVSRPQRQTALAGRIRRAPGAVDRRGAGGAGVSRLHGGRARRHGPVSLIKVNDFNHIDQMTLPRCREQIQFASGLFCGGGAHREGIPSDASEK
jgi:hypothetical protein